MFGKIEAVTYSGIPFSLWIPGLAVFIASVTDFVRGKIYNWLTVPLLFSGLLWAGVHAGFSGVLGSFLGILITAGAFMPMFFARVMGAGDVKLLFGLAAWLPWRSTVHVLLLSVLVGGVVAAFLLLLKGRLGRFLEKLKRMLLSVFLKELAFEAPPLDRSLTFPFGIPIAIATWWVLSADPFSKLGGLPWDV